MVAVAEADKIIQSRLKDFGTERVSFESALGRILAKDIRADRDFPPYDRVTMDGIAIRHDGFASGIRSFRIVGTQAAGDDPINIQGPDECVEIMTGAALPETTDTVIRYEDLQLANGVATITTGTLTKGQSIHTRGLDKRQNEIVAGENQYVTPALVSLAASVGATELEVRKQPKIVIVSTGDELVQVDKTPLPYQIRTSNNYSIRAVLQQYALHVDMIHIPDDPVMTRLKVNECLEQYDVIILTGGVSMGKFDFIPRAMDELSVRMLFYKVSQRPGKPFWFGAHDNGVLVFAFPGNPVSTFMCMHRYFLPWLEASSGINSKQEIFASLDRDFIFKPPLQYFLQVALRINNRGHLIATPTEGNGSGDFANLLETDAFMELPSERDNFKEGEVFRVWPFRRIV